MKKKGNRVQSSEARPAKSPAQKKGNCVTFPVMRLAKSPAHRIPTRSLFRENEEAKRWLIDMLFAADIKIDDELFWMCYEHPLPPDRIEREGETSEPDLIEHLYRAMAQVWAFRRSMVYKVINKAMCLINEPPSRFHKYLPNRENCWEYLPHSLWAYVHPVDVPEGVPAEGGSR